MSSEISDTEGLQLVNAIWQALSREAALAAEHLAIGASTLHKANYAHDAHYAQAFFALSIGLERATKLALIVDHAIAQDGDFPSHKVLRKYGHNLKELLQRTDEIAERREFDEEVRLPRSTVHDGIVTVLSDFASNVTRYYDLDFVTGDPRAVEHHNAIYAWFKLVTTPVLSIHYRPRQRARHQQNARLIDELIGDYTLVRHHSETGNLLDSAYQASVHTAITDFAKPYTRMYVLQIARFLAQLLSELGYLAHRHRLETVPYLSEFFAIFNNDDKYFKQRKTWSIYRP